MADQKPAPKINRSVELRCVGDWGQANFHRILSWLTQEFCDRTGPQSRTLIASLRDGGMDSPLQVQQGAADIGICTPANILKAAATGEETFAKTGPLPDLRALAALPQRDRMMFAIHPRFGVKSFAEIREHKLPLRIAVSADDGTNFIGYVAARMLEAHGLGEETVSSWGGSFVKACRPEQVLELVQTGQADAVVQEAIMTPWWRDLIESKAIVPISVEDSALSQLGSRVGFNKAFVRKCFWKTIDFDVACVDFSDFLVLVPASMSDDVAYLLTWCLVETRQTLEAQYRHIPPERSPLSYPLDPVKMAHTTILLHPAAERFYKENGYLSE
ncbi:uncharacterized protein TRUGW13939_10028 [Talaromyces rugulosus]|uniref:TRAP transporter solute receptor, TAXI family n=1 Tax=Talaromyces rugulosus TaxID=121627 RepID=A0A7H8REA4_TALRU|nr:uncharacterized protein TRUGW13939_10028 [Talaromyces rugulosus]QKX62863.1 hypothetical protein TRUGW13939_10028 [Talaromyces rugulosus]